MQYIIAFILMFLPLSVQASEPLKVTYSLYASGFNVLDIESTYILSDDNYRAEMDLKTVGLLGTLVPWSGDLQTSGLVQHAKLTPQNHSFAATWRGETKTSYMVFKQDGGLKSYKLEDHDGTVEDKMPHEEVYADNPIDMLSAVFQTMMGETCAATHPVLDGKRRFDMVFKSKGKSSIEKSKYTIFNGEAEICDIEIIPISGKWREKPRGWMSIQEQAKDQGQLPRMWFGKIRDDFPPIPVRFLLKTNYGTMVMHVKAIDGKAS